MPDTVDPSIALQAGRNLPQFGPDLQQVITLQRLAQDMQARQFALQQEQQGQNALRQVFGNQQNIDPSSGLPRPQALAPVMQANPELGMNLLRDIGKTRETDLRMQLVGQKVQDEHRNWAIDQIAVPAVAKYRDVLQQTGNQEHAQTEAQKVYSEGLGTVKADGRLGASASQLSPTFDFARANANIMGRKGLEKAAEMDLKAQEPPTPYQRQEIDVRRGELTERQRHDIAGEHGAKKGKEGLAAAKEITVFDDKGNALENIAAVDDPDPNNPSKLKHFGTDKPVVIPEGGHVGVGKSTVAILGSRESQLLQRQLGSGVQASKAIKDIVALPSTVSRGVFGGRRQGEGLMDAAKETLTTALTTQDVQAYNAITPGVTRSLALIDSQGLSPGANFTESFNAEMLKEGDTQFTKLLKLSRQREIVDAGMETLLTNPRLGQSQKDKAQEVKDSMAAAVPWTPIDVINLMRAPKGATLRDVAAQKGLAPEGAVLPPTAGSAEGAAAPIPPATSPPPPLPTGGVRASQDPAAARKQWREAPSGTIFYDETGRFVGKKP